MQASGLLEDVARLALVTATRASRLRLPCETYTPILDDDPLPQGTISSSVMRVRCLAKVRTAIGLAQWPDLSGDEHTRAMPNVLLLQDVRSSGKTRSKAQHTPPIAQAR